jgi:hypothetical protein
LSAHQLEPDAPVRRSLGRVARFAYLLDKVSTYQHLIFNDEHAHP